MTPDPVLDKLTRFTPNATSLDAVEILFRAGRASARTPWGWKVAVAALLLANIGLVGDRQIREAKQPLAPSPASPDVNHKADVEPTAIPTQQTVPSPSSEPISPWSLGALLHTTDLNELPRSPVFEGNSAADTPLTPRSISQID